MMMLAPRMERKGGTVRNIQSSRMREYRRARYVASVARPTFSR
jgi:hypothetical protein